MAISTSAKRSTILVDISKKKQRLNAIVSFRRVFRNFYVERINNFFDENVPLYSRPVERGIWLLVHLVAFLGMAVLIYGITSDYNASPTVISAEIKEYPVQNVDFPAIAICNINRISYKAVVDLAEELLEFQTTTYNGNLTLNELVDTLKYLGSLYHFQQTDEDLRIIKILHTILERGYNGYDITRIMKRLTPKCRYMLKRCSWSGRDQVCEDIFSLRRTQEGYCCTFNYARRNDGFGSGQRENFPIQSTERTKKVGSEYGLSILLNPEIEDYAYKILPGRGFKVLVFSPYSFPEKFSGGVQEILISPKTETFLNIRAISLYSIPEVIQYDVLQRDCLFNSEKSTIFQGFYSYNECIMHCRVQDILKTCKCVPFFHPFLGASARTCNLKDLVCLRRYREKWLTLKPRFEQPMVPFDPKSFNGKYLDCDCYPSCEDVAYKVTANTIPLTVSSLTWNSGNIFTLRNHSVLHINFADANVVRLRQDILFYWYELLSNYGGVCNLFLGISFINVIEILYIVVKRFLKDSRLSTTEENKSRSVTNLAMSTVQTIVLDAQPLYWHEINGPVKQAPIQLINACAEN